MGDWGADQSKGKRRYHWGQTRGEQDAVWKDFAKRLHVHPELAALKFEKIGPEIHCWREIKEDSGEKYWMSCLRFVDDAWGYWSVFYRTDERRWRTTPIKERPLSQVVAAAAEFYKNHF